MECIKHKLKIIDKILLENILYSKVIIFSPLAKLAHKKCDFINTWTTKF